MMNCGARVSTTADNHDKRLRRNSLHLSSLLRLRQCLRKLPALPRRCQSLELVKKGEHL
jgi:hypothetical protein